MRFFLACTAASLALCVGAATGRAGIVITDTTFANANWSQTLTGSGTVTSSQDSSFGNPSPSRKTLIQSLATGDSGTSTSLYTPTTFNPSVTGPISGWTWTLDHRLQSDATNVTLNSGKFALRQNGSIYTSTTTFAPLTASWLTATADAPTASLWTKVSGSGPTNPNFLTGPTIEFGYRWAYTGVFSPIATDENVNVDNFSLTLASVPEPGSMILLGLAGSAGAAAGGWRRWRRRKTGPQLEAVAAPSAS